jgi:LacI family transcriptional regulator
MKACDPGMPRASADPVSQRDIARHFGVSHVTVSLALRNSKRVSKRLTEEIRGYAEAVGYRRDPVLVALADYRKRKTAAVVRGALAWINAWPRPDRLRGFSELDRFWRGASEAAKERGFRLEEFRLGTELVPERLHQVLETRNIRGILLPPHPGGPAWQGFPWADYAIVSFGRAVGGPRGHRVLPSATANMALALQRMRSLGYQRIGCLTAPCVLRQAGYCMAESLPVLRRELPGELPLLDLASALQSEAPAMVRDWVRAHRLDAVLADDAATGGWLVKAGLSVPDDVALATLAREGEAGIDPGSADIGRSAIHLLDELLRETIAGAPTRFREVSVDGTWVDGASAPRLAPIPAP